MAADNKAPCPEPAADLELPDEADLPRLPKAHLRKLKQRDPQRLQQMFEKVDRELDQTAAKSAETSDQ